MRFWSICAGIIVLAFGLVQAPINDYIFFATFVVLQAVVLATAWNILGGYAGYVNFGVPAFVGAGAYSALVVHLSMDAPLVAQILFAALISGSLGFLVGLISVRLRGIFFSIATVALVFILETVVINWRYVGGATGLQLTRPTEIWPFDGYVRMLFWAMVVMAVIAVAIARYIQDSHFGRGLRALRDSEDAAECAGVPTLRLKLMACTVSGALLGAAGAPMPMYMSYIEPYSSFNLVYAVSALAMPIIGGMSHWIGPLVGAILLATIQQIVTVTISSELNVLVVGVLLVVFVIAAPDGIVGLYRKWKASSK
jgi:branched-chain amino acid transport system permease protein